MKSFLKAAVVLFLSTQALAAVDTLSMEQLNREIQLIKSDIENECHAAIAKELLESTPFECQNEVRSARKDLCGKKREMVSYFEAITSNKNIKEVAKRFDGAPPADALGGVLIWQMKNSINQVNSTWVRSVDKMKPKAARCLKTDIKKELTEYTDYIKSVLNETTLLVEMK